MPACSATAAGEGTMAAASRAILRERRSSG